MKIYTNFFIFFSWFFNLNLTLQIPVKSLIYEEKKDLLGKKYIFPFSKEKEVKSPMRGKILKLFSDGNTVLISNNFGFQIIIGIRFLNNSLKKNIEIIASEGKKVKSGDCIFLIKSCENLPNYVVLYIPWQPLILKEIKGMKIYYRNPLESLKIKLHGLYF